MLDLSRPVVMGILNTTPDSFFDGGRHAALDQALRQAERMLSEGASIIDVGGASSRPGAPEVPESEEMQRVIPVIETLSKRFPELLLSVDTWRAPVARAAVEAGAKMVNDISAGKMDPQLYPTLAELNKQTPIYYVLMHMQGTPVTMQKNPEYENVVVEVLDFLIEKMRILREWELFDVIVDPGFGFGKTVQHNYALLRHLADIKTVLERPVLVGISRKSMICKPLNVSPENALNGTTALHMAALQNGANILRVHDVKEAVETIKLFGLIA